MSNKVSLLYFLLLTGWVIGLGCDSNQYTPQPPDPPYELNEVRIKPAHPSFDDTVKLKLEGNGDKSTVVSYNWIIEEKVHSTNRDSLKWVNEEDKESIDGKVEGKFQGSTYQKLTNTLEFTINFKD